VNYKQTQAEGLALVVFGAVLVYLFLGINLFLFTMGTLKIVIGLLGIIFVFRGIKLLFKK